MIMLKADNYLLITHDPVNKEYLLNGPMPDNMCVDVSLGIIKAEQGFREIDEQLNEILK